MRAAIVGFAFLCIAFAAIAGEVRVQKILGGRGELSLPAELTPMDEQTRRAWHRDDNPPQDLFGAEGGAVSLATSVRQLPSVKLDDMLSAMVAGTRSAPGTESWHGHGKRIINGREFGYVEFTARVGEVGLYNYIYFTIDGNLMITFVVNCPTAKLPAWKSVLDEVVSSTRIFAAE